MRLRAGDHVTVRPRPLRDGCPADARITVTTSEGAVPNPRPGSIPARAPAN